MLGSKPSGFLLYNYIIYKVTYFKSRKYYQNNWISMSTNRKRPPKVHKFPLDCCHFSLQK